MTWAIYVLAALGVIPAAAIVWLAATVVGNLYGGVKGAYRLRAVRYRYGQRSKKDPHWQMIRLGMKAWDGKRYRNGLGHYWQLGGMIVPVDGRDPIAHDHRA